jgi:hypothetical protein
MMYGALFEVFALLPLSMVLRRMRRSARGTLITCGIVLWAVAVALNTWATAEFSLMQLPARELTMFLLPLLLPGLALVLVFGFVAQSGEAA